MAYTKRRSREALARLEIAHPLLRRQLHGLRITGGSDDDNRPATRPIGEWCFRGFIMSRALVPLLTEPTLPLWMGGCPIDHAAKKFDSVKLDLSVYTRNRVSSSIASQRSSPRPGISTLSEALVNVWDNIPTIWIANIVCVLDTSSSSM